ncbi:MAG: zinc ribbon domain-containing protein [Methanomassiliicoccales archaeon]|nr:zinc ribbon domain-containing protein [Methanomassiliicoccales archaeon]
MEERSFDEVVDATCPSCRQAVPAAANVCPNCGYRLRPEQARAVASQARPVAQSVTPVSRGSSKSLIGGILVVISGLIGIVTGLILAVTASTILDALGDMYGADILQAVEGVLVACGVIWFIIGLIALIGGIFAIRRKRWGIAIVGGVFGLLTIGPYFIGSILGLIGLILIAISKDEFS